MSYSAFAAYYDTLTDNISYKKRAEYFDKLIRKQGKQASILLDLACGTGSLSLEFASLGYDVIGVDGSAEMLSVAMQKQGEAQLPKNILFLCQQMDELDLYGTVDVAVCALDSLNHITDKKVLQKVFDKLSLFLDPEGLFVFDVNSIYKHEKLLGNQTFVFDREGVYCVWQNGPLQADNSIQMDLDFFEYDPKEDAYYRSSESFCERAYSHQEICAFLEASGLELLACYGDDSEAPPTPQTQRLIYLAQHIRRSDAGCTERLTGFHAVETSAISGNSLDRNRL